MVKFLHPDTARAQAALADIGVRFTPTDATDGSIKDEHLHGFIPGDERHVRRTFMATPPAPMNRDQGPGAWHINNAREAHSIIDGQGLMQFATEIGVLNVLVEAGDGMLIDGAEHRYLPLTPQTWLIRHGGPSDYVFTAHETGASPVAWPETLI